MTKKRLDQVVYELIIKKIETGQLHEKEHITEQAIANELQISRTPVRKAFVQLVEDNYLEAIENTGVRVRPESLNVKKTQDRIDFVEQLINYYLFNLEKKEIQFDVEKLEVSINQLKNLIDTDDLVFEEEQLIYWKELLKYHNNQYAKKNILKTLRNIFFDSGPILEIMKESRNLIVEHLFVLIEFLNKENYPSARREIRILFNQLKLNVIEKNQNYY